METKKSELGTGIVSGKLNLTEAAAANDAAFQYIGELPVGLRDLKKVVSSCRQLLDAPDDLPMSDMAFQGIAAAVRSLELKLLGVALIADRIEAATSVAAADAAAGATLLSLSGRTGRHLLYSLAIHIGHAAKKHESLDELALAIFGAWCLRRLFADHYPSNSAIAKVQAVLTRPNSREWSEKARSRAHELALRNLDDAVKKNETAAAQFGLVKAVPRLARTTDPIDVANREFRRRVENLIDFSNLNAVSASGGYGTLAAVGLLDAGQELLARVRTGDKKAVLVCLEIITHLSSETTLKLPLQIGNEPPKGALIWLDVRGGTYCQTLFRLIERGARPTAGTEHLYESTTQIVSLQLSPPLRDFLLSEMNSIGWGAEKVEDILGVVGHHPRSAVVGDGVYRCTARRLQESLPALLLDAGQHRWPVALATNSHFLVSRGRPSYGACTQSNIDVAMNAAYRLLGWPTVDHEPCGMLVGSFTTPTPASVTTALNFLADEADISALKQDGLADLTQCVNRHAQWIAIVLALGFALRRWVRYALPGDELRAGADLHFDDKDIHEHKGPPVPTAQFVHHAMQGWFSLCQSIISQLRMLGDQRALDLANRMDERISDTASLESIFTINAVDRLEPVGCHTWVDALPENIRLRPSFARQFWPLQLMTRSVEQSLIDILTRHQIDGLHLGSSHSVKKLRAATARLRACMDQVLDSLSLRMPKTFGGL